MVAARLSRPLAYDLFRFVKGPLIRQRFMKETARLGYNRVRNDPDLSLFRRPEPLGHEGQGRLF